MRQAAWVGAFVLVLTVAVSAQERPATIDDILSLKTVGSPTISPDGTEVIYTVRQWQPSERDSDRMEARTRIWHADVAGGTPRQLTFGERNETQPDWSPDGRYISFVSSRGPEAGGEAPPAQIYLMRTDGGEAIRLTDAKEAVSAYAWSPDGTEVAFVTTIPRTSEEKADRKKRDDERIYEGDFRYSGMWIVDVATKHVRQVVGGDQARAKPLVIAGDPVWSPDGRNLAFQAKPTPMIRDSRSDIYIASLGGDGAVAIAAITTNAGPDTAPRWSPDGKWIAYRAEIDNGRTLGDGLSLQPVTNEHLMLYDVAAKRTKDVSSASFDFAAGAPVWSADSSRLFFTAGKRTYNVVFAYDLGTDEYTALTTGRSVGLGTLSRDGSTFAVTTESPSDPSDIFVVDAGFTSFKRVATTNPQVRSIALGESEVITWKSSDGLEIEGVLLKPVGHQQGRRVPLLVVAHGGPTGAYTNGWRLGGLEGGQVLAGQGWAVLYPNVRGSTNYGEKFMRANIPDWGGGDWHDLMAGVDAVIARGIADPDKLALIGWSYGGYMTAWGITQTTRFKAAMVGAGITNVWSMYGTNDIPNYLGTFFGGIPGPDTKALYLERSAMSHVDAVTTPTLILHGAEDDRVPTGQALELHRALKDRGKTTELVFYPREGHGLQEYHHLKDRLERIHAWLTKYALGGVKATTAAAARK